MMSRPIHVVMGTVDCTGCEECGDPFSYIDPEIPALLVEGEPVWVGTHGTYYNKHRDQEEGLSNLAVRLFSELFKGIKLT